MNQTYSVFADLSLASKYFNQRDSEKALHYLERIPDDSFAAAQKHALMGRLFDREKQYEKAIAAFEKSIRINGGDLNTEKSFVGLLDKIDPARAQGERKTLQNVSSFYQVN